MEKKLNTISDIYLELSKPLPEEAIQRSKGSETKKGYDTTGYGYQFIVNRFNEVLGLGNWNWNFEELERTDGTYKSGQKFFMITGQTTITISVDGKEISHTEFGGHQSASVTDALKGASTNAFKKTAAFFGVGKQAFEKSIDEDNQEQKEVKGKVKTSTGKTVSIQSIITAMKKCTSVEDLEKNKQSILQSKIYNPVQKGVIARAIEEKIIELNNV